MHFLAALSLATLPLAAAARFWWQEDEPVVVIKSAADFEHGEDLRVQRFVRATVPPRHQPKVDKIVRRILADRSRYEGVDATTGVPWYVIAGLHNMESGGSFRHHLHEGSPLVGRTRWVPVGRPKTGNPPFKWEDSARDALEYDGMGKKRWAYLYDTLWAIEVYNGTGYWKYHRDTPSPYLYSATSEERPGKYVSDGRWSSTARSEQIGVAAIFKRMEDGGVLNFNDLR